MAGSERTPNLAESETDRGLIEADVPQLATALRSTADFGFTGTFVSEDAVLSGSLQIRPDRVIMWAAGSQLASWAVNECSIERVTASRFSVQAHGETLTFTADDPAGLNDAIAVLHPNGLSTTSKLDPAVPVIADSPTTSRLRVEFPKEIEPRAIENKRSDRKREGRRQKKTLLDSLIEERTGLLPDIEPSARTDEPPLTVGPVIETPSVLDAPSIVDSPPSIETPPVPKNPFAREPELLKQPEPTLDEPPVAELPAYVETHWVPDSVRAIDAAPVFDTARTADTEPIIDTAPIIDSGSVVDTAPTIDSAAVIDAPPFIDNGSVVDQASASDSIIVLEPEPWIGPELVFEAAQVVEDSTIVLEPEPSLEPALEAAQVVEDSTIVLEPEPSLEPPLEAAQVVEDSTIVLEPEPSLEPEPAFEAPQVVEPTSVVDAYSVYEISPEVDTSPVAEAEPVIDVPPVIDVTPIVDTPPVVDIPQVTSSVTQTESVSDRGILEHGSVVTPETELPVPDPTASPVPEPRVEQAPPVVSRPRGESRARRRPIERVPLEPDPVSEPELTIELPSARAKSDSKTEEAPASAPTSDTEAPVGRRPRIKSFQPSQSRSESTSRTADRVSYEPTEIATEPETERETVAEGAISRVPRRRVRASRILVSDVKDMGIKIGAVVLAVVLAAGFAYAIYFLMGGSNYEPPVVTQATTTLPPTTATTEPPVVTTIPLRPTTLFDTDPSELTRRWNALADAIAPELALVDGITSPMLVNLTPFITLEGSLDPVDGQVTLRSTPTGLPAGDGAILSSMGLMIATADPSLKPDDRRLLLQTLGLDVHNPQLGGIDGGLNYNGLNYRLIYLEDVNVLEFTISPTPTTPVTTAP